MIDISEIINNLSKEMEELKRLMEREKELIDIISNSVSKEDMESCCPDL